MRILLYIAIAAIVVLTVWSSNPTVADQNGAASIDPAAMMMNATNLPTQHYAEF